MRIRGGLAALGAILAMGCATAEQWAEWRSHSSHFASGDHIDFSGRNRQVMPHSLTPQDVERARAQGWWGGVVPQGAPLPVAGTWRGSWTGPGLFGEPRASVALAVFTQDGYTGEGRLALHETGGVEQIPLALREGGAWGVPVVFYTNTDLLVMHGRFFGREFRAEFVRQGDRLVGRFPHAPNVSVTLVRARP